MQQRNSLSRSADVPSGTFSRCASNGLDNSSENAESSTSCNAAELREMHEDVIQQIITGEEPLIAAHRQVVDKLLTSIRGEFKDIGAVEAPESDIGIYVRAVMPKLDQSIQMLLELREKFAHTDALLAREETLQKQLLRQEDEPMDERDD